jgi:DNA repair exonuclease SbcCD ATPase subunit
MKFPTLTIDNFLAITHAEIKLADRGLVLVQGENEVDTSATSNGSGKSSIPDALCWCWFGVTARGVSADDVINIGAGKGCRVISTVQDGAILYTATRHRKHKTGKNTLTITSHDGIREVNLTKGTDALTQEVANDIIGASLEVFKGSIYAGQEQMPNLPAMTDKVLKVLIEEAAGVVILEAAYGVALKDKSAVQHDLSNAEAELVRIETNLDWLETRLSSDRLQISNWDADHATRTSNATTFAQSLRPSLVENREAIALLDEVAIAAGIAKLDAQIASVSDEQSTMIDLERKVAAATGDLSAALNSETRAATSVETRKHELLDVVKMLGLPCPECGSPITEAEIEETKNTADTRLKKAIADHAQATESLQEAQGVSGASMTARDAHRASLTDLSASQRARDEFVSQRSYHAALSVEYDQIATEIRNRIAAIQRVRDEVNPFAANIDAAEKEQVVLVNKVADAKALTKRLGEKLAVELEVVKIYGPAGVRARILDEVTPFLNGQTSKYLSILSDGNIDASWSTVTLDSKGNAKERFAIDVVNATGAAIFKGLSGGEKRKVRVATALALQDLVATRATKPIDLFIGDEIDDALDPAGIERLMTVLEEKAKERGSVFLISHSNIRDFVRNLLTIKKTSAGTVILETTA